MNLRNQNIIRILFIFLFTFVLSSCSKYDDPAISFRSKKARVEGQYHIKNLSTTPDTSKPEYFNELDIEFIKEGGGEMKVTLSDTILKSNFQWEFNDEKTKLRIRRYYMHPDHYQYIDSIYNICFNSYPYSFKNNLWAPWGNMMEINELSNDKMEFDYVNDSLNLQVNIQLSE